MSALVGIGQHWARKTYQRNGKTVPSKQVVKIFDQTTDGGHPAWLTHVLTQDNGANPRKPRQLIIREADLQLLWELRLESWEAA